MKTAHIFIKREVKKNEIKSTSRLDHTRIVENRSTIASRGDGSC